MERPKIMMVYIMVAGHIIAFCGIGMLYNNPYFWRMVCEIIIMYFFTGMLGITAGAHRLWAHQSYKAKLPTRIIMMIANSIANQKCIYKWVLIHRVHHKYADTESDPHNINNGFLYAHMGWLIRHTPLKVKEKYDQEKLIDIKQDPVVMFQYYLDPYWNSFWCFIVPGIYGWLVYNSFLSGFVILGVLRWVIVLHCTWTINSIAHTYGTRPYKPDIKAANSFIGSALSGGEGSHNFHHVYPNDYAASEFYSILKLNWNPTTYFIDFLAFIGQAYDLQTAKIKKGGE